MRMKGWLHGSWAAAALALALPLLGGCSVSLDTGTTPGQSTTGQQPAGSGSPAPAINGSAPLHVPAGVVDLQQGTRVMKPPAGFSCSNQNLRGCFTESDMVVYYEYVLPFIDPFYESTWPSVPLPAHVYFMSDGATMHEACQDPNGGDTADDMSYEYCPADDNVYIGQQLAWALYSQAGDVAPATGLAHELGHNVQTHVGVPVPQTDAETLVHENQADCVAGAWLGYANSHHLLLQSDEPVIEKMLELIASSENDPNRTHGDFQERGHALELGGEQGIAACNSYYPGDPIVSS
jgi:Putative neutral zinc metallopeptidase